MSDASTKNPSTGDKAAAESDAPETEQAAHEPQADFGVGQPVSGGGQNADDADSAPTGAELAQAQRDRDPASVGPHAGLGVVRRVTADEGDAHRDWTVQSGRPFPSPDQTTPTRFHPAELPDPRAAASAGFIPLVVPDLMVDGDYQTQPPSMNVAIDDPLREHDEDEEDDGALRLDRNVLESYKAAQAQKEGRASYEVGDDDGTVEA